MVVFSRHRLGYSRRPTTALHESELLCRLLERAVVSPTRYFSERELLTEDEDATRRLYQDGLLQRRPTFTGWGEYDNHTGRRLTIIEHDDGTLHAVDLGPKRFAPLPLLLVDLPQWRLALGALAAMLARLNQLQGVVMEMDERLYQVGEAATNSGPVLIVLGLIAGEACARSELLPLKELIPRPYHGVVAVCPAFEPSPALRSELHANGLYVIAMPSTPPYRLELPGITAPPLSTAAQLWLTPAELVEYREQGFRSQLPILVTGRRHPQKGNVVEVDDAPAYLGDVPFMRFLLLALAVLTTASGFIDVEAVMTVGGGEPGDSVDQMLSRIRRPFLSVLQDVEHTAFIQKQGGRVRLSTHHAFIRYDRTALLEHPLEAVRRLARRLPPSSGAPGEYPSS